MRISTDLNSEEFKNAARGGIVALRLQLADMEAEINKTAREMQILISECEGLLNAMKDSIDGI